MFISWNSPHFSVLPSFSYSPLYPLPLPDYIFFSLESFC